MNSNTADSALPEKRVHLPDPDMDNITVLTRELPNEPILPWHHYDSPWLDSEPPDAAEAEHAETETTETEEDLETSVAAAAPGEEPMPDLEPEVGESAAVEPTIAHDSTDPEHPVSQTVVAPDGAIAPADTPLPNHRVTPTVVTDSDTVDLPELQIHPATEPESTSNER